jgi:hypothetical protein
MIGIRWSWSPSATATISAPLIQEILQSLLSFGQCLQVPMSRCSAFRRVWAELTAFVRLDVLVPLFNNALLLFDLRRHFVAWAWRKPIGIRRVKRVVRSKRVRLTRHGQVRIDDQELVGGRVVIAPYY